MARRPKPVPQMTVAQFDATFPDEDACKAYLQARRWPDGVRCPRCDNDEGFPGQLHAVQMAVLQMLAGLRLSVLRDRRDDL